MQSSQVRFMVDGERIAPDDTAEKLGLEDEDLIDVANMTQRLLKMSLRRDLIGIRGHLSAP